MKRHLPRPVQLPRNRDATVPYQPEADRWRCEAFGFQSYRGKPDRAKCRNRHVEGIRLGGIKPDTADARRDGTPSHAYEVKERLLKLT